MSCLLKNRKIIIPIILLVFWVIFLLKNYWLLWNIWRFDLNISQNWPIILIIIAIIKIINIKK
jgi:hypothetical protein